MAVAGAGKSTLLARIVHGTVTGISEHVIAHFFFQYGSVLGDPNNMIRTIATQIMLHIPEYREKLKEELREHTAVSLLGYV